MLIIEDEPLIAHDLRSIVEELGHNVCGMARTHREAVAAIGAAKPGLILADEPTGNLDSRTSIEIMGAFQELNKKGITIAMVTHELDIAHYCKRNLILRDGVVVRDEQVQNRSIAATELSKLKAAEAAAKLIANPAS